MSTTKKSDDKSSGQSPRKQQASLLKLRRRTNSARGAIVLSALTVLFILLSLRTGNLLFEFDSIVSFLAALVLLFRDTSHTVQARVVNRILTSSRQLVADLSAYGLGGSSFLYVPEGRKVGDVMLVPQTGGEAPPPISSSDKAVGGIPAASMGSADSADSQGAAGVGSSDRASSKSGGTKDVQDDSQGSSSPGTDSEKKATTISNLKFAPPGRAMAELFLRESALKDPTMDDIIAAIPETIVDGFQLADSSSVSVRSPDAETVEVTLVHPVLISGCGATKSEGAGIVGCEVCSMLAVLFSSSTSRVVSLDGCTHYEASDASTTSLHLGAKYPAD